MGRSTTMESLSSTMMMIQKLKARVRNEWGAIHKVDILQVRAVRNWNPQKGGKGEGQWIRVSEQVWEGRCQEEGQARSLRLHPSHPPRPQQTETVEGKGSVFKCAQCRQEGREEGSQEQCQGNEISDEENEGVVAGL